MNQTDIHLPSTATPPRSGALFAVGGILVLQTGTACAAKLFDHLGVSGTSWLRLLIAALLLFVFVRPALSGRTPRQWASVCLLGVASGGMTLLFSAAVDRIPLGIAATIEFLGPLSVAVVASRRLVHGLCALLAGAGVALICFVGSTGGGASLDVAGIALAAAAAACWAGYIVYTRAVGAVFEGYQGLAVSLGIAAVVMTPVGFGEGVGGLLDSENPALLLAAVTGVALLAPVTAFALEMTALRRMPARTFGILTSLEPAVAALAGLVLLGQSLAAAQLAGLACVVAASAGATWADRASADDTSRIADPSHKSEPRKNREPHKNKEGTT
ncbi:EamA family transporter [Streptomyces sp. NPDC041068]|uniref:EamA family transporter n=1 Tax=Streptomyces sp. NPDC041068 TaxID=3155130 RepID=UPI0033D06FD2